MNNLECAKIFLTQTVEKVKNTVSSAVTDFNNTPFAKDVKSGGVVNGLPLAAAKGIAREYLRKEENALVEKFTTSITTTTESILAEFDAKAASCHYADVVDVRRRELVRRMEAVVVAANSALLASENVKNKDDAGENDRNVVVSPESFNTTCPFDDVVQQLSSGVNDESDSTDENFGSTHDDTIRVADLANPSVTTDTTTTDPALLSTVDQTECMNIVPSYRLVDGTQYFYVSVLENNKYFIGTSTTAQSDHHKYMSGELNEFTIKNKPLDVMFIEVTEGLQFNVDALVSQYALVYGTENVKGQEVL